MTDKDQLNDIERRLESIQDDVNDIQGDVRVLSTLNKELSRDELVDLIRSSLGDSKSKKLTWYYASGSRTIQEIADASDLSRGSIDWALGELNKSGWVVKHESEGNTIYDKAEVSTNLGIEQEIEDEFDL
jgi:DNA-binding transcriptional ArsR family regulator